jgi:hypothetical protein
MGGLHWLNSSLILSIIENKFFNQLENFDWEITISLQLSENKSFGQFKHLNWWFKKKLIMWDQRWGLGINGMTIFDMLCLLITML